MAEYDPLTISDEELKQLTPAERGAVYKARAAARAGGAAPAPAPPSTSGRGQGEGAPAATTPAPAPETAPSPALRATSPSGRGEAAAAPAPPPEPAPPPKPAPPPEPEKSQQPAFVERVLQSIEDATFQWRHGYAELKVPREHLLDAATILKNSGFDYLSFITEVDWQDRYELVYHLFSYDYRSQPLGAILRCELPHDVLMPEVASLTAIWPGAEFMEREAFEMMGIRFLGHPDLRRILLPDDFVGFPMRRDYETDWDYITVKQLVHETD